MHQAPRLPLPAAHAAAITGLAVPAISRCVLMVVVVIACASCSPLPRRLGPVPLAPGQNGAILERAACTVITNPRDFSDAVRKYYLDDILEAKLATELATELAARPLASTFSYAENLRLAKAVKAGRCERVMYRSSGLRVAGFVLRPAGPGPHPVVIWLRGGSGEFGKIDGVMLLNLQWLADAGFMVIATQYRGADGGEGHDEFGGADVDDVMALLPLARSLPGADMGRLYLLGNSRGAMQGTIAMRRGLPVRAAAFRGGVFDLTTLLARRPDFDRFWRQVIPHYDADGKAALQRRSAVNWARELRVPVLFLHGRKDMRSHVDDVVNFDAMLAMAGVERKMVIYERDQHQLALHRPEWLREALGWFRRHGAFDAGATGQRQDLLRG